MCWINYEHINIEVPRGTFGGAMCMCEDCKNKRDNKPREIETGIEIMMEVQYDKNI